MPKKENSAEQPQFVLSHGMILIIFFILTVSVPLLVLPAWMENPFNAPKNLIILGGACLMAGIYLFRLFTGRGVLIPGTRTPYLILVLILLNLISFFYTKNFYFTKVAALLNISCLIIFYLASLFIDSRMAVRILLTIAVTGVAVSILTCCQYAGYYPVLGFKGPVVMATIGNSNFLGAYLLFPLFALAGLVFVAEGRTRILPAGLFLLVFVAFLFSRARASWLGIGLSFPVFLILVSHIHGFHPVQYLRAHAGRVAIFTAAVLALFALLWFAGPQRFRTAMEIGSWTETRTLNLRWKYWQASIQLIKENPLFGEGLWSYRNRVYEAQAQLNESDPEYFKDYEEPKPRRVHNEYLEVLNDGGLVAAAFLALFFIWVMRHGFRVIRDPGVPTGDRIITATAFSSLAGIMLAAFFFFPFRLNSTLFMTALMMGIMEGLYIRNRGLISESRGRRFPCARFSLVLGWVLLLGLFWFGGLRPFMGEMRFFEFKRAMARLREIPAEKLTQKTVIAAAKRAERHVLEAVSLDPGNSYFEMYAGQMYMNALKDYDRAAEYFDRALVGFNGDLSKWSVYHLKGILKLRMGTLGSLREAQDAFTRAIYYNPDFLPARKRLKTVNSRIKTVEEAIHKRERKASGRRDTSNLNASPVPPPPSPGTGRTAGPRNGPLREKAPLKKGLGN